MSLRTVEPKDEHPHQPGEALGWSEAYSFFVTLPEERLALLTRMGVRPNEGIMDVGLDVFVADGGLLSARHVRPQTENTSDLEVEGVRFELVEPLDRWRISYDGPAHSLRSSREADSHDAWHKSRLERLSLELSFTAECAAAAPNDATGRFGQAGRFTGEIWISGDRYPVDAAGLREKSWGSEGAVPPQLRRRFWCRFDDGSALVVDRRVEEGREIHLGWMLRAGVLSPVVGVKLCTQTEEDALWQRSAELLITDGEGRSEEISVSVEQIAPLPTVRGAVRLVVCSSVAQFSWGSRSGLGVVEYLHRLGEDGHPELPIQDWG